MPLKAMDSQANDKEAMANRFGAISQSHQIAIMQMKKFHLGYKPNYKVLDLCVGTGALIHQVHRQMPEAEYTGIDVSAEALKRAQDLISFHAIEASATQASKFLPPHSQDLLLAHFVNANIPIVELFNQAKLLTRANGHFSMITTTYDSFPIAQQKLAEFIAKDSILSSIIGHYYKSMVKGTAVAPSLEDLLLSFKHHQFDVIAHQRLELPITLNNIDELALFGIDGTWFLNNISVRMLPKFFLIQRIKRLFSKIFTFPYHDTHIIDIVLAKK